MSHVDKSERRRQNGQERDNITNIGNGNAHKTRAERYRNNNKKNISPKSSYKGLHRTNSQDHVRRLVEKEGRAARNLVTWSVPVSDEQQARNDRNTRTTKADSDNKEEKKNEKGTGSPGKDKPKTREARSRSNSASRKKIDLRARYWSYLFDNLKRAVDEIYTTCETDESVMECQEVIMMLDQCRNDFQSLIDRIQLHAAFEKADSKDRPRQISMRLYIMMQTAKVYDEVSQPQIEEGMKLIHKLNLSEGDKVLDMGCGTGHVTKYIADIVGPNGLVVGIDPDVERIIIAKEKYKEVSNLQFCVGSSLIGFPHDNEPYYDVHISTNVFHWVPSDEKIVYIQKAHQCLKHGGKLAVLCAAKEIVEPIGFHSLTQEGYLDLFQETGLFDNVVVDKALQRFQFKSAAEFVRWYQVSSHQEPSPEVAGGFCSSEDDGRVTFIVHSFAITACNH